MITFNSSKPRLQRPIAGTPFHVWMFPDGKPWTAFHRTEVGYLLRFPSLADFSISADAHTVTCFPVPAVSEATVVHLYLNQVLPLVQSKLGKLVFHASAVEVNEGAVAFVGRSGRGKSTLAASFAVNGSRFLTDDGLVVAPGAAGFEVLPGHPSIRLWGDSERALIPAAAPRAPSLSHGAKARLLSGEDLVFCSASRPLRRVYFLGDDGAERVELRRMTPAESLVEWVRYSFLLDIEKRHAVASHFDRVASLAGQPIHYRLDFPRCFAQLAQVRDLIIEHAGTESRAA